MRPSLAAICIALCSLADAQNIDCANEALHIDSHFEGGRLDQCRFTAESSVELTFRNEDYRVDGAYSWFAFRIAAADTREVDIRLHFPDSHARFWPKLSRDGHHWEPAPESAATRSEAGKSMTLRLTVDETGTWVAAQELLTKAFYDDWLADLETHYEVETSVIGASREGRPIHLANSAARPEAIVLIGRQHPAEVPGALAMREFVATLLGPGELAREFRERFMVLVVPNVNPDGVASGNARHNEGLTDLNRDWGPFTQPETRSVASLLESLAARGIEPRLMLDFHATRQTETMIFYTQMPEDDTRPAQFASRWLAGVDERLDAFEVEHAPRAPSGQGNTKNWFFRRYGIPAITYEVADEFDRGLLVEHTPLFAEEMMRAMLASEAP